MDWLLVLIVLALSPLGWLGVGLLHDTLRDYRRGNAPLRHVIIAALVLVVAIIAAMIAATPQPEGPAVHCDYSRGGPFCFEER